jgi:hypothetical protein
MQVRSEYVQSTTPARAAAGMLLVAVVLAVSLALVPAADAAPVDVLAVEEGTAEDDEAGGGGAVAFGVIAAIVLMGLAFRQVSNNDR